MKQQSIQHEEKELLRLNKFISSSGYCSRREADRLIEAGRVTIDGVIAQIGEKVTMKQIVKVDNTSIHKNEKLIYLAFYKPVGVVCTTDLEIKDNIISYIKYPERIFPIGRLDKDSSGLILLTNDGDVVNKILRSVNNHEKEYIVSVNKTLKNDFLTAMMNGVKIYNPVNNTYQVTKKCHLEIIDSKTFKIILTEGLNRQIRRMCTALGYRVTLLKRIRIMNVHLDNLNTGKWRSLSEEELSILNADIHQ